MKDPKKEIEKTEQEYEKYYEEHGLFTEEDWDELDKKILEEE